MTANDTKKLGEISRDLVRQLERKGHGGTIHRPGIIEHDMVSVSTTVFEAIAADVLSQQAKIKGLEEEKQKFYKAGFSDGLDEAKKIIGTVSLSAEPLVGEIGEAAQKGDGDDS